MIIDIEEQRASHFWLVCMDAFKVNFNSLGEAQAFVGLLRPASRHPMSGQVLLTLAMRAGLGIA